MKSAQRKIIFGLAIFLLLVFIILTCPRKVFSEEFRQSYFAWLPDNLAKFILPRPETEQNLLFFEIGLSDTTLSYIQKIRTVEGMTEHITQPGEISKSGLIFIFEKTESLDSLEKRIKANLSLSQPKQEEVLLPDKSTFIEFIADPEIFGFRNGKIKDKEVRYWRQGDQCEDKINCEHFGDFFEIVLWQNEKYNFVSNSFSLAENIIENINPCFLRFQKKDFDKGIYFQVDELNIKNLMVIQTDRGIKGCIELNH